MSTAGSPEVPEPIQMASDEAQHESLSTNNGRAWRNQYMPSQKLHDGEPQSAGL